MNRPPFFARIATALLVIAAAASECGAQAFRPPASTVPIAVTYCHTADSVAPSFTVTFVDAALLGSDSLPEILVHEQAHERMNRDSLSQVGHCPGPLGNVRAQLEREVYAYCISDSVRVARTHDVPEAGRTTVGRLVNQFHEQIPVPLIAWLWALRCPRYAWSGE